MTYSFRSLYHSQCDSKNIYTIGADLDRAQLPSSHFFIKEKILWHNKGWFSGHAFTSKKVAKELCSKKGMNMELKKFKRKSIIEKPRTLQDLEGVLPGEDKTKHYFSKWGKEAGPSSCSLLFTAAPLTGVLLGHCPWQHNAKAWSGVSSSGKCCLPFCMGTSMHCSRVVLLVLNRGREQWASILTLASSQECGSSD